ncbi:hypothetical protein [Jonquetella sp. BV3C21]|uniref:hypothetical protein n=1 Tax=Jonquetella sp. BV3C21 TaxID=1111126 RepID=UPI0012DCF122|nr:hypothetical protein [Jonquetella sp. BV3C21]
MKATLLEEQGVLTGHSGTPTDQSDSQGDAPLHRPGDFSVTPSPEEVKGAGLSIENETALQKIENSSGLQVPPSALSQEEPFSNQRVAPPRDVVKETGTEYAISPNETTDVEYSIAGGAEAPKSEQSSPIEASYKVTTEETPDLVKLIREGKFNLRDEGGMTPDHVPTQGEQLTRIRDITKQLEKIAPLRTGSKLGPNTLGYYQPIADVARTRADRQKRVRPIRPKDELDGPV